MGSNNILFLQVRMIDRELPSVIFEIGSVIEDVNGIFKILKRYRSHSGDSYKVEVIKWHLEPPEGVKQEMDLDNFWILVTASAIPKIKVLQ